MRNVRNVRVLDWDFDMVFEVLIEKVNGRIWSKKRTPFYGLSKSAIKDIIRIGFDFVCQPTEEDDSE